MYNNPLYIDVVREFFEAEAEVKRRRNEVEEIAQKERVAERRAVEEAQRNAERAEFKSALEAVRDRNAVESKQREALKGKDYGEMSDQEFRIAMNRDFRVTWCT